MKKLPASFLVFLVLVPCVAYPESERVIKFRFEAHANNVRVMPPLVGSWQLGTVKLSGDGEIVDGVATGSVTCVDKGATTADGEGRIECKVIDATYKEEDDGETRQVDLVVEIETTTHDPREGCQPGLVGRLELYDSDKVLGTLGNRDDWVRLGSWMEKQQEGKDGRMPPPKEAMCGHEHGFHNREWPLQTPPPHEPQRQGLGGGLWAYADIRRTSAGMDRVQTIPGARPGPVD